MPDEVLSSSLELDISSALSAIEQLASDLDSGLSASADAFSAVMADAVSSVPPADVDIEPVGADAITSDIDAAVTAADTTAQIDATGAESITSDIDAAVGAADTNVSVEADTSDALATISAIDPTPLDITVEADTGDAQAAIDELDSSASSAAPALHGAAEGGEHLSRSAEAIAASTGLAVGSTGEFKGLVGGLSSEMGAATLGVGALGGGIFELYQKGLQAVSATERFDLVVGHMKDEVESVNVGTLNTDLASLGAEMGDTRYQTETAAATIFQFASNAGASGHAAAGFADDIFGLAARAVALNPALGSVSDVAVSMEVGLGRARSAAQKFGISISQAEINSRAMSDTNKSSAADLTAYEKSVAGAEIALERYGGTLGRTVAAGSQNAAIQQRALTAEFDQFLEDLGTPLVSPGLDLLATAIPIGEDFGRVLGGVAQSVLPAVTAGLDLIGPPLGVLADVLSVLSPAVTLGAAAWLAYEAATVGIPFVLGLVSTGTTTAGAALALFGVDATGASIAVQGAVDGIEASLGPIGLLAAGLGIAFTAFGLFSSGGKSAADAAKEFDDQLTHTADAALAAKFNRTVDDSYSKLQSLGLGVSRSQIALQGFRGEAESNVGTAARLLDALQASGVNTERYAAILDQQVAKQRQAKQAADESKTATDALTTGTASLAEETNNAADLFTNAARTQYEYATGVGTAAAAEDALKAATTELGAELDRFLGRFLSADQATNAYKTSVIDLGSKLLANGFAFDDATKAGLANRDALDEVASKADSASTAIFNSTHNVEAAKGPLIDLRGHFQELRDKMAAAGQDTSFIDGLLAHVDAAIAGVGARVPESAAAGAKHGKAVGDGSRTELPNSRAAGEEHGHHHAGGVHDTAPESGAGGVDHALDFIAGSLSEGDNVIGAGRQAGSHHAEGINTTFGESQDAGSNLGLAGVAGSLSQLDNIFGAGATSGAGHAQGITSQQGASGNAGAGLAQAGATAASGYYDAYYQAGLNAAAGLPAGLRALLPQIIAAGAEVAQAALNEVDNVLGNASPSKEMHYRGGLAGEGFALGLEGKVSRVTDAGAGLAGAAFGPIIPSGRFGAGGGSQAFVFNIAVNGVSDPKVARRVGSEVGAGAVDALVRRRIVMASRTGG